MAQNIALHLIDPDPEQPRKYFDPEQLNELAASLAQAGLAVPILVRPVGERFMIVHGERRWRAAQQLGWSSIPADVRELDAETARWLAFVENMQRADLSHVEEARFYEARLAEGMTQAELGKRIGKSQQYVADRLSLLRLEPEVQTLITARAVSPSVGRRLATVEDPKLQMSLARKAADERQTVKVVEGTIKTLERRANIATSAEFERWGGGSFTFARLVEADPAMEYYRPGIERGEFKFVHLAMRVVIQDLTRPFTDQPSSYPRYTGVTFEDIVPDYQSSGYAEDLSLPLFTEAEWDEFITFDEGDAMEWWVMENMPGMFFEYKRPSWGFYRLCEHTSAKLRRSYDPGHGRLIIGTGETCPCDTGDPLFIRQGWGYWRAVEFNDGDGGRERRRVFQHDVVTSTLINEVLRTLDTDVFSATNFDELAIWDIQPIQMSWHAIRRKTVPKEEAIAALEADLARLRNAEPLTDAVINEQALDRLQACTDLTGYWREGICSYPRHDDGSIDAELYTSLCKKFEKRMMRHQEHEAEVWFSKTRRRRS